MAKKMHEKKGMKHEKHDKKHEKHAEMPMHKHKKKAK